MLALDIGLLTLLGAWLVALGRLASTWRDAAPVTLVEPRGLRARRRPAA